MQNAVEDLFPRIFCIEEIQRSTDDAGRMNCRATLYHDQACVTVVFNNVDSGHDFEKGEFVSVCWLPDMHSEHGAIQVAGLTVLNSSTKNSSLKDFNPFLTVPHTWDVDRHLIDLARELWDISSKVKRQRLFAAFFAQAGQRTVL